MTMNGSELCVWAKCGHPRVLFVDEPADWSTMDNWHHTDIQGTREQVYSMALILFSWLCIMFCFEKLYFRRWRLSSGTHGGGSKTHRCCMVCPTSQRHRQGLDLQERREALPPIRRTSPSILLSGRRFGRNLGRMVWPISDVRT